MRTREKCSLKMDAVLENKDEKLSGSGFGITVDVSLNSDRGVFRRYHVVNEPITKKDPFGLFDDLANYAPDVALKGYVDPDGNFTLTGAEPINYPHPKPDFRPVVMATVPVGVGLVVAVATENVPAGMLAYGVTESALGICLDQPAGLPGVPISPLINPPSAE
jgi:hypothetical protein